jgi:hypothetical protein
MLDMIEAPGSVKRHHRQRTFLRLKVVLRSESFNHRSSSEQLSTV